MMTLREAILEASTELAGPNARRDAELLLAHVLQRDRAWLLAHGNDSLTAEERADFEKLVARRAAHEPLQHLTGIQEFYGLQLRVTRDTLIPRPETELLVEAVLGWATTGAPILCVLDVGTGTGAIAIAIAKHLAGAEVVATDISPAALTVARENAARHGVTDRIRFVESDLLAAVSGGFDVIVSNPPYIALEDAPSLAPEVREYEPHAALFAGEDGLAIYRRLIPQAHDALLRGGLLALEIGFGQSEAVLSLLPEEHGWRNARALNDYADIPRVVLAERA